MSEQKITEKDIGKMAITNKGEFVQIKYVEQNNIYYRFTYEKVFSNYEGFTVNENGQCSNENYDDGIFAIFESRMIL